MLQAALLELQDLQAGARLLLSLNALAVADIGQALRDIDEQASCASRSISAAGRARRISACRCSAPRTVPS